VQVRKDQGLTVLKDMNTLGPIPIYELDRSQGARSRLNAFMKNPRVSRFATDRGVSCSTAMIYQLLLTSDKTVDTIADAIDLGMSLLAQILHP
jgi:hypothetical protein